MNKTDNSNVIFNSATKLCTDTERFEKGVHGLMHIYLAAGWLVYVCGVIVCMHTMLQNFSKLPSLFKLSRFVLLIFPLYV